MHALKIILFCCLMAALPVRAATQAELAPLAGEDFDAKLAAVDKLADGTDPAAKTILQALSDGNLSATTTGQILRLDGERYLDAASGAVVTANAADLQSLVVNNRMQRHLDSALAGLSLFDPGTKIRLAAAQQLADRSDAELLPVISKAVRRETNPKIKKLMVQAQGMILLSSAEATQRLAAARALGDSDSPQVRAQLAARIDKSAAGSEAETDPAVRRAIAQSVAKIDHSMQMAEYLARIFSGISLGSVLMLAALGLAIIYGLMGVINMAHGEFLMIGAYATYMVQGLFRHYFPAQIDWYLPVALPVAFGVTFLVGVILERSVIRWLYGRPLESLLATWGLSLILIQLVRTIFGPQNVEVANPSWMSGGWEAIPNLILPYNRMVIIAFSLGVLLIVWLILTRTRLGLFVRGVTQNRKMADCLGVPTSRVDTLTFGFGAGIAGLGGVALSQIGNVGPELGQSYIVDSFMVVVLGGVGQLAGTVTGGFGLGIVNKFLEPWAGAVMAKIIVLILIIAFIQKRPQGLFAMKGRQVDN
ncbi:urea ABC transporter permease subunit UrtB [Sulfuriferula sp.]|uniref:urea ABC transporter permease subunit UrtB n=1 Tax=Sulfuriferula sp. TaxID=2025307 RepID=UPI00272FC324|nr:urea ABC transporter permease subunit UrtB [Sulfuriferula sp.]MDP2025526.1 urea ABC transporter permease subunit UrtB [Sulfuriferula sp.]